ncbi:hypothetical protein BT69DRAFT_1347240 [Atractiella rhizophila]|nr:hypothetical protein BT69DRAFT_1347240 [Atractiella rhizophila]
MVTKVARARAALVKALANWFQEFLLEVVYDGSDEDNKLFEYMQRTWDELTNVLRMQLWATGEIADFILENNPCFQPGAILKVAGVDRSLRNLCQFNHPTPNQLNILPYEVLLEVFTICRFIEGCTHANTTRLVYLCRGTYPVVHEVLNRYPPAVTQRSTFPRYLIAIRHNFLQPGMVQFLDLTLSSEDFSVCTILLLQCCRQLKELRWNVHGESAISFRSFWEELASLSLLKRFHIWGWRIDNPDRLLLHPLSSSNSINDFTVGFHSSDPGIYVGRWQDQLPELPPAVGDAFSRLLRLRVEGDLMRPLAMLFRQLQDRQTDLKLQLQTLDLGFVRPLKTEDQETIFRMILSASHSLRTLRIVGRRRCREGFYGALVKCEHLTRFTTDLLLRTAALPSSLRIFEWEIAGSTVGKKLPLEIVDGLRLTSGMILNSNVKAFHVILEDPDLEDLKFELLSSDWRKDGVEYIAKLSSALRGKHPHVIHARVL